MVVGSHAHALVTVALSNERRAPVSMIPGETGLHRDFLLILSSSPVSGALSSSSGIRRVCASVSTDSRAPCSPPATLSDAAEYGAP